MDSLVDDDLLGSSKRGGKLADSLPTVVFLRDADGAGELRCYIYGTDTDSKGRFLKGGCGVHCHPRSAHGVKIDDVLARCTVYRLTRAEIEIARASGIDGYPVKRISRRVEDEVVAVGSDEPQVDRHLTTALTPRRFDRSAHEPAESPANIYAARLATNLGITAPTAGLQTGNAACEVVASQTSIPPSTAQLSGHPADYLRPGTVSTRFQFPIMDDCLNKQSLDRGKTQPIDVRPSR